MSAYENIEVQRLQKGVSGKDCISKKLELFGLTDTGKKKVNNFSLGMKQRVGLGLALVSDPEFLILEEPTNGLDPMGMVELIELLMKLHREKGLTVLLSNNLLSELDKLPTTFGIIHKGKHLEELTSKELDEKCRQHIRIKVDDSSRVATVLENHLSTTNIEVMQDGTIQLYNYLDDVRTVSRAFTDNDL